MSSIEALWLVKFGDFETPNQVRNGGVIVFESGRAFGGDSGFAYVGRYDISGTQFTATLTITQFNSEMGDVWGLGVSEFSINVHLEREANTMRGTMTVVDQNQITLPLLMQRFRELP
jgi:hypothetical protein